MSTHFQIEEIDGKQVVIVTTVNITDAGPNLDLEDRLLALVTMTGSKFVLDFSQVQYCGAVGWAAAYKFGQRVRQMSGLWKLCGIAQLHDSLRESGMSVHLPISATREEALAAL